MNAQLNLSAIRDAEGIRIKHIMDSIELQNVFTLQQWRTICDVGTWGGFPLLPLAMLYPQTHFIGIDARRKKVDAVNSMIATLQIPNAQAIRTRSEDYHEQFDVVTARAVSYSTTLFPSLVHLIKPAWYLVLYKQTSLEERADLLLLCKKYHLHLVKEHTYRLFTDDIERVIYILVRS